MEPTFKRTRPPFTLTRKTVVAGLFALGFTVSQAQVIPTQPPPTTPPELPNKPPPSRPQDPDRPVPPIVPQDPVKPKPQGTPGGWVMFDEHVGKDLGIDADRLNRLRDVDTKYQKDYGALGKDPAMDQGYRSLTDRRNAEVKGILTPQEYSRWIERYNGPADKPSTTPNPKAKSY
ncbi:MAG: hypothetical protein ABI432_07215 [Flavobacteriales bacterium]